jgi:hypothetical protein
MSMVSADSVPTWPMIGQTVVMTNDAGLLGDIKTTACLHTQFAFRRKGNGGARPSTVDTSDRGWLRPVVDELAAQAWSTRPEVSRWTARRA